MIIKNVRIITDGKVSEKLQNVEIHNGVISDISDSKSLQDSGLYLAAGYIDIHTHGGYGHDYFECSQAASDNVGRFHLMNGTTSFVATSVATPLNIINEQISLIRGLKNNYARMLGIHMEGPFISIKNKGAQPEEFIRTDFNDEDKNFFFSNKDILRIVTFCPKTKNSDKLVKCLKSNSIIAHIGHDDSIYPDIIKCIESGVSGVTHIYCASSGVRRIEGDLTKYLGANETAMLKKNVYTEVIADDMHISEYLFKYIYKNKGYKRICLVSDSLSAAGMPIGNYKLGNSIGIYNNGKVALLDSLKALAGSITPVSGLVKNAIRYGIPLAKAVYMGTQAPARHLKLNDIGSVEIGMRADLNIFDNNGNVIDTYLDGVKVKKE